MDDVVVAIQEVDGLGGDAFSQAIDLSGRSGPVEVRARWYDGSWLVCETTITLLVG